MREGRREKERDREEVRERERERGGGEEVRERERERGIGKRIGRQRKRERGRQRRRERGREKDRERERISPILPRVHISLSPLLCCSPVWANSDGHTPCIGNWCCHSNQLATGVDNRGHFNYHKIHVMLQLFREINFRVKYV